MISNHLYKYLGFMYYIGKRMVRNHMDMEYILLVVAVIFASANSVVLHKAGAMEKNSIFNLNLIASIAWCVILFFANGAKVTINAPVLIWGVIYGIVQALFILFKAAAMSAGPVAITTLMGNSSLLISTAVSLIVWNERVSAAQVVGVLLLLIGIFFCTYKKSDEGYSPKWKLLVIFFLIFAAGVGITFKAFSKSGNGAFAGDMMLVSAVIMVLSFAAMSAFSGGFRLKESPAAGKKTFLLLAILSGILSCVYNRLNIYTSGEVDAIIFFPCFNGGVILLSAVLSVILCGEKLTGKQKIGILVGIAAIIVTGVF